MSLILFHFWPRRAALALVLTLVAVLILGGVAGPTQAQIAQSTISGRVFDRSNGQALGGVVVTIGYQTLQRATVSDSAGRYRFSNVPATTDLDVISFLAGYTYLLKTQNVSNGQNINLDFGIIVQPDPGLVPKLTEPKISTNSVEPGQEVTFSMKLKAGSEAPLSPETMAINPVLGKAVLLKPMPGDLWVGTFKVPEDTPEGNYPFTLFGVDEACREPVSFPVLNLSVTKKLFFSETGKTVPGSFLSYWNNHGGLAIFGYPISEAVQEVSPTNGKTYLVQYFERNRFEYHPELAGTPYEVLLGLLGRQVTAGRENEGPFQPVANPNQPGINFYPEVGLSLRGLFKDYWDKKGGLAQFGFPITEEFSEVNPIDGKTYRVQYFERARFENHPENKGTQYEVLLGLLGRQIYKGN